MEREFSFIFTHVCHVSKNLAGARSLFRVCNVILKGSEIENIAIFKDVQHTFFFASGRFGRCSPDPGALVNPLQVLSIITLVTIYKLLA